MKRLSLHVVFVFALIIVFAPGPEQNLHHAFQDQYPPQTHVMYCVKNRREFLNEEIEETKRQNYNVILTGVQKPIIGRLTPSIAIHKGSRIICSQRDDANTIDEASEMLTGIVDNIRKPNKGQWA